MKYISPGIFNKVHHIRFDNCDSLLLYAITNQLTFIYDKFDIENNGIQLPKVSTTIT
jgi:hypothetical protein